MSVFADIGQNLAFLMLVPFLAMAVATDVSRRQIPNLLIVYMIGCGVAVHAVSLGTSGLVAALGGLTVGLGLLLPFYVLGGMGAGDVKLLAAAGTFLGPYDALLAAIVTLAAGGVLAVAVIVWRGAARLARTPAPSGRFATALGVSTLELPYSLAISAGTLFAAYNSSDAKLFAPWMASW